MWAHGSPKRQPQVIGIGKDTFGPFVDFGFAEAIETLHLTGFIPEVAARTERAFAVGHHEIRWHLNLLKCILNDRQTFFNHRRRKTPLNDSLKSP